MNYKKITESFSTKLKYPYKTLIAREVGFGSFKLMLYLWTQGTSCHHQKKVLGGFVLYVIRLTYTQSING